MNRITIEPGPLPNQWAHIWYKDFTIVRTAYFPNFELTVFDAQWMLGTYVWVTPPLSIPCAKNSISPAKPDRVSWYTEEEKKQFAVEQRAKREAVHTQEENQ